MIVVRYYAGARAAAGCSEEKLAAATLDDLIDAMSAAHGPGLARVLSVASFLVDGVTWHDRTVPLPADATVDVLPPFAGG
jgi:molybdopterin converting factor small subunit